MVVLHYDHFLQQQPLVVLEVGGAELVWLPVQQHESSIDNFRMVIKKFVHLNMVAYRKER